MKTLLHTLFLLPLAFTTVACDEAVSIEELEARELAGEFDIADEDSDGDEEDEDGYQADGLGFSNGDPAPTHGDDDIDDLDNGPNPTHGDVDDFTAPQGDPDTFPVDTLTNGEEDEDEDTIDDLRDGNLPHGDPVDRSDWI